MTTNLPDILATYETTARVMIDKYGAATALSDARRYAKRESANQTMTTHFWRYVVASLERLANAQDHA